MANSVPGFDQIGITTIDKAGRTTTRAHIGKPVHKPTHRSRAFVPCYALGTVIATHAGRVGWARQMGTEESITKELPDAEPHHAGHG